MVCHVVVGGKTVVEKADEQAGRSLSLPLECSQFSCTHGVCMYVCMYVRMYVRTSIMP